MRWLCSCPLLLGSNQQKKKNRKFPLLAITQTGKEQHSISTLCHRGNILPPGLPDCLGCTFLSVNVYTCRYSDDPLTPPFRRQSPPSTSPFQIDNFFVPFGPSHHVVLFVLTAPLDCISIPPTTRRASLFWDTKVHAKAHPPVIPPPVAGATATR